MYRLSLNGLTLLGLSLRPTLSSTVRLLSSVDPSVPCPPVHAPSSNPGTDDVHARTSARSGLHPLLVLSKCVNRCNLIFF